MLASAILRKTKNIVSLAPAVLEKKHFGHGTTFYVRLFQLGGTTFMLYSTTSIFTAKNNVKLSGNHTVFVTDPATQHPVVRCCETNWGWFPHLQVGTKISWSNAKSRTILSAKIFIQIAIIALSDRVNHIGFGRWCFWMKPIPSGRAAVGTLKSYGPIFEATQKVVPGP